MIGHATSGDHQRKDDEWRNSSNGFSRFIGKPGVLGHSRSSALLLARMWVSIQTTDLPSSVW
jgi:hypothetical protein